ncbi:hypothetical protein cypCar_00026402 [Cyprinus carpio]|nr:hypothetical protein cypCar_00026402 [Cyprinus carpio]
MSCLEESAKIEENDTSMSRNSQDILNSETFCAEGTTSGPSVHCPEETMALLSDQGDLLTTVGFMDTICSDGPAKAAYVNGSTSPHISDEILLDISKNVPGFLPKSLHAQNSVTTNVHFEGPDPLRKEGEITIRQTLTAEDVEHRGIWGFDTESPESSLDHYDDGNDLNWNPQREFMKFLWDDDNGLEMEGKLSPVPSPINHKRRAPSPLRHKRRRQEDTSQTDHPAELKTDCQQTELICPLCREWFDTGTGLSNHVRGHLKRLGKPSSTASKSPVIILKELMRDKKQFQMKLQVLEKKCRATNSFHPIRLSNGLTFASTVKRQKDDREEKKRIDIGKASPPSELIGILKKRRAHEETKAKHSSHTARKAILLSSDRDCGMEIQPFKAVPNSLAAFDCKQRKQRSRFCDLVFQGPLSVQEDWIKHLQRHIMNTAVPHTGAGMVEVTSFPKDSCPNTVPQAQPSVMQISS